MGEDEYSSEEDEEFYDGEDEKMVRTRTPPSARTPRAHRRP